MAITERDRRNLHDEIGRVIGPEPADTLMELLPKHPTNELVTSTQLAVELAGIRAEMVVQGAELRTEINRVENSLTLQIANLHATTTRLFIGLAGANIVAMVTALVT